MTGKDCYYHFCYWEKQSLKRLIICTTESLFQYRNREQWIVSLKVSIEHLGLLNVQHL